MRKSPKKKKILKLSLQERQNFSGRSKTIKIIRIKKAKVVKISTNMIAQRALELRKLEIKYNQERDRILNQQYEVINDKIKPIK